MSFLTEKKLSTSYDLPVALPATELRQGDWLVLATIRIAAPMTMTLKLLDLQLMAATVDTSYVVSANKINTSLGLVFIGLYQNYRGQQPHSMASLDLTKATTVNSITSRSSSSLVVTEPASYSFVIANNMKTAASNTNISSTMSIDFEVSVVGQVRIDLVN